MANPGLTISNATASAVYVALVYNDNSCGPTDQFRKQGWWKISAGASLLIITNDLRTINQYIAWYADDYNGGPAWKGPGGYDYLITNSGFDQCYDNNNGCTVRFEFQELDFNNNYGMILTLTSPGHYTVSGYGPPPPPPPSGGGGWVGGGGGDDDDDDDGGDE